MKNYILILVIAIIAAAVLYFWQKPAVQNSDVIQVTDFQSCAEAGYPITQSNPEVCTTPAGQVFTSSNVDNPDIVIDQPQFGDLVKSPMTIKGKVRGNWFFEANLPIILKDDKGNILAQQGFHTSENWMTNDYLDLNTTLTFPTPTTEFGVLIIQKDNPSGLPQNDLQFAVPVKFK